MKTFVRQVRAARKALVVEGGLDIVQARDLFFSHIISHSFLRLLGDGSMQTEEGIASRILRLRHVLIGLPECMQRIEQESQACAHVQGLACQVANAVIADPLLLGWAYQFWNETERDESTWAISRRGEEDSSNRSLAAATQIFTEDYMASFIAERWFSLQGGSVVELSDRRGSLDVLDPACGTGHMMVHALRRMLLCVHVQGETIDLGNVIGLLHGCDIDRYAVDLCRVVLLLESMKSGLKDIPGAWATLCSNIQVLSSEYGTLDRDEGSPLLHRRYGSVITNPPYIGRRKLSEQMRAFLDTHYPASSMDLCAAFMERCTELVVPGGVIGLVTVDKWLRLRGYEPLRTGQGGFQGLYRALTLDVVCELGPRAFSSWSSLHDGVGITLIVARVSQPPQDHTFHFVSCAEHMQTARKAQALREWCETQAGGSEIQQSKVQSPETSAAFVTDHGVPTGLNQSGLKVCNRAQIVVGLQTSDDRTFVRYVWSVPPCKERWLVHSKGGGYGRWFGFNRFLLDWQRGLPIFERNRKSGLGVQSWFQREGWTYTWFANGALGLRKKEQGWSFGRAAASGLFCDDARVVGFLNSRVASLLVRRIGGKAQLPEGIVRILPLPTSLDAIDGRLVGAAVAIKRAIVARDLTDVAFIPNAPWAPMQQIYLNALLLVVEGAIEHQVQEALGMSRQERAALDRIMGRPAAWNPSLSDIRDDRLWLHMPMELQFVRELLHDIPRGTAADRDPAQRVLRHFTVGGKVVQSSRPLPATSLMEEVCRSGEVHPLDCAYALESLIGVHGRVKDEVVGPMIRARLVEEVLSLLGHQWWSTTARYDPTRHRSISVREIAKMVRARLSDLDPEELLGEKVENWIGTKMESWQERLFFGAPLIVKANDEGGADRYFTHAWVGGSLSVGDTLESRRECFL